MLADAWSAWLKQVQSERQGVYISDPDEVTANFDREVGHVRDYHGREILELVQNADDAGREVGANRVRILLGDQGLCVGNTGAVFNKRGVKSLVVSDNSPKREAGHAFIGNRGLGFRSILNWTESPFVLSGHLRLAFDREKSIEWFRDLLGDARIAARVQRRLDSGHPFPAPILGVPLELPLDDTKARNFLRAPAFAQTFDAASAMRADGFDTVIGVPFAFESARQEVEKQLGEMSEEILLFLNNLQQVEVGDRCWRVVERSDTAVVLEVQGETRRRWSLYRSSGEVPENLLRSDQLRVPGFEIRIAVPENDQDRGGFFSYLPTEIRFPFGVIAHATVELTNNRQNLADTKANQHIITHLAGELAEVAERRAANGLDWAHLSIVAPAGDLDPILENFGFKESLLSALKTKRILPCRDGQLRAASHARKLSVDPADWLPLMGFGDLARWTSDPQIVRFLDILEVHPLSSAEMRVRLEEIATSLSVEERARLVVGLVEEGIMPIPPPRLLTTEAGEFVDPATPVFLPPQSGLHFDLPPWMQIRFLDPSLTNLLLAGLEVQSSADLRNKLRGYRIRLYSFASLVSALNAAIKERLETATASEHEVRLEGLTALKRLFDQAGGKEGFPARPADIPVLVPDRAGAFRPAATLYFGVEYGSKGLLSEELYGFAGDGAFVAGPGPSGGMIRRLRRSSWRGSA